MLVATIELWPHGHGQGRKVLEKVVIANIRTTVDRKSAHYEYWIGMAEPGDDPYEVIAEPRLHGILTDVDRSQGSLNILGAILEHSGLAPGTPDGKQRKKKK